MDKQGVMLAIDTSTSSMTVAVMRGSQLLGGMASRAERNHSLYLVPQVQQLLRGLGLSPRDLEAFAVGVGPGSYTGVRIGITVAKTMAWALGRPVIGVSSLEALALGAARKSGATGQGRVWTIPLMDARRTQASTGLFASGGSVGSDVPAWMPAGWKRLKDDRIVKMDAWIDELLQAVEELPAEDKPECVQFVGEVEPFAEWVDRFAAAWSGRVEGAEYELQGEDVALLGSRLWAVGELADVHAIVPNYTQLAEAEAKLIAKQVL